MASAGTDKAKNEFRGTTPLLSDAPNGRFLSIENNDKTLVSLQLVG